MSKTERITSELHGLTNHSIVSFQEKGPSNNLIDPTYAQLKITFVSSKIWLCLFDGITPPRHIPSNQII
jgi:hypothetical protein